LDQYILGKVERISPEAPVPVIDVVSQSFRLGGAANVVANIRGLGGQVDLVSVVGNDENGTQLRKLLLEQGANVNGLQVDENRPTTIKTRVIAQNHQIVRIDREVKHEIASEITSELMNYLETIIPESDALVFSDYDKGVVTQKLIKNTIEYARRHDKPVIVDPKHRNFWHYQAATIFKPNQRETETALGHKIQNEASLYKSGKTMLQKLNAEVVLITRGRDGMSLFQKAGAGFKPAPTSASNPGIDVTHIPAIMHEVFDVTGAGDTVTASLALALAAGADTKQAARLSNHAAAIVVGKVGTASVTLDELASSLNQNW